MEIRALRYFLMAAREENITKAADLLHITQPTLSRQLQQLDVKLFQRSNHSIRLTEDGMLLKRRAQEIVALADKTEKEFQHKEESISGEIVIGSGETKGVHEWQQPIRKHCKTYDLCQVNGKTKNAMQKVRRLHSVFCFSKYPIFIFQRSNGTRSHCQRQ